MTPFSIILISILVLISSIGTPTVPGLGGIVLFTILSGLGYNTLIVFAAYLLILAINRPIEMLVTILNVVGDSATMLYVVHSEKLLDKTTHLSKTSND